MNILFPPGFFLRLSLALPILAIRLSPASAAEAGECPASAAEVETGPVGREDLAGRRFLLAAVDGEAFAIAGPAPTLEFLADFGVAGSVCNRFRGQGELAGGVLFVRDLILTRRFCFQPELNRLEAIVAAMLAAGAALAWSGDALILSQGGHELVYAAAGRIEPAFNGN
ncbi:MAG: META domain-containing protein [Planctomycetota bacterium]|jgi:heat shock protein HslJ|nr:META domain-containing protein [Planctomycetota bacterium]